MLVIEFGSLVAEMFKYFTHKHEAEARLGLIPHAPAYVLLQACGIRAGYMRVRRLFLQGAGRPAIFDQTGLIKSLAIECVTAGKIRFAASGNLRR